MEKSAGLNNQKIAGSVMNLLSIKTDDLSRQDYKEVLEIVLDDVEARLGAVNEELEAGHE